MRIDKLKPQIAGSLLMIAVMASYVLALPAIATWLPDSNKLEGGQRFTFADGASIVPADGWSLDLDSSTGYFTVLVKAGLRLTLTQPYSSGFTLGGRIQMVVDQLKNDTKTDWLIDEPRYFETDDGVPIGEVTGHSAQSVQSSWFISDGNLTLAILCEASSTSWQLLSDELDEMIRTVIMGTGAGGA